MSDSWKVGVAVGFHGEADRDRMKSLKEQILHHDSIYLSDPRQMERMEWLKKRVVGRGIEVGIGNGWSTDYLGAAAGTDIRADRVEYASIRFPHISFFLSDSRTEALFGYDTVVMAEVIEHMTIEEARGMLALWTLTRPRRFLLTAPNAGYYYYDEDLIFNQEHIWYPTERLVRGILPAGYDAEVDSNDEFILVCLE